MPKVKSKNTPARPPTSRTRRPAHKDAEPLNSAPTTVPTPPTAGPQHQEVAAPMSFPCGTLQTEVVSTAAPIPTLISDTQDIQRLHISGTASMQFSPQPLVSVGSSLGNHVSQPIKQKILKGEYIDLAIMLQLGSDASDADHHKLTVKDGQLAIVSNPPKARKLTSIERWTDAMLVFAGIYISGHIDQAPHLLKYIDTIRTGASRNPNSQGWLDYDKQFRLRKSIDPSISWSAIDSELWLIYMASTTNNPTASHKCYDYNFKGYCSRQSCLYSHLCMYCSGSHPQVHCARQRREAHSNASPAYNQPFRSPGSAQFRISGPSSPRFNFTRPRHAQPHMSGPRQYRQMATRSYPNNI